MNAVAILSVLNPRPLGSLWSQYPGISSYGVLRRAWRINQLQRSDLRPILGLSVRAGDDLFAKSLTSSALKDRLSSLYPEVNRTHWDVSTWWPLGGRIPVESAPWRLRECPLCARGSYHSLLFQMPGVTHCPWHGEPLIDTCPKCDRPLQAGWQEGLSPGKCLCGHDLVDELRTVTGAPYASLQQWSIDRYLNWAVDQRRTQWLLAPEAFDPQGWKALDSLVRPPCQKQARNSQAPGQLVTDGIDFTNSARHAVPRLAARNGLEQFKPTTAVLPLAWYPPLRKIETELIRMLPTRARQAYRNNEGDLHWTLSRLPACPCGNMLFLQTECLHRVVLRLLGRLTADLTRSAGASRFTETEGFAKWIHTHPWGTLLLEQVIQRVLLRGYADGARVAIGRHVPELYDDPRRRPITRFPWVVISLPQRQMPSAKIVWTRQLGTA